MSTPRRASCFATMIFSSTFMLAPGDCSPSRNVVSKIRIMRVMSYLPLDKLLKKFLLLIRPPLARRDAPFPKQGRSVREPRGVLVCSVRRGVPTPENDAGRLFQQLEAQKPPSQQSGTKALRTPWYHPGSAMNGSFCRLSPFIQPVTRARRNPLLSVHGFGSEGSSTLNGLVCTIHQLSQFRPRRVLFLVAAVRTLAQLTIAQLLSVDAYRLF